MKKLTFKIFFHHWTAANMFACNYSFRSLEDMYFPIDTVIVVKIRRREYETLVNDAERYNAVAIVRV